MVIVDNVRKHISFFHGLLPGRLAKILSNQLNGEVFSELAVQTAKGIRVSDVDWGTKGYVEKHINDVYALSAPELCVEITSSSNTREEMLEKVELFIESGAKEVWLISEDGVASFYNQHGQRDKSNYRVDLDELV